RQQGTIGSDRSSLIVNTSYDISTKHFIQFIDYTSCICITTRITFCFRYDILEKQILCLTRNRQAWKRLRYASLGIVCHVTFCSTDSHVTAVVNHKQFASYFFTCIYTSERNHFSPSAADVCNVISISCLIKQVVKDPL